MGNDQKKEKAREKGRWFWGKRENKRREEKGRFGSKWDSRYNVIQMTHIKFITAPGTAQ